MVRSIEVSAYGRGPAATRGVRRRLTAILVVLAIAAAGALIGRLTHRADDAHLEPPGPFSNFPV